MHPNLFHVGPLTVHTYGVMLAIGFLAAVFVVRHYARRENQDPDRFVDLVFFIFVSALAGAKLLQLIVEWDYYSADWSRLTELLQIGGVFYGGLILAIIVAVWYMRKQKMKFWQSADILTMGLPIGHAIGRLGCFFAGCCWGKPASAGLHFPLAVTFRNPDAADLVGTPLGVPLYDTQLWEAAALAILFGLLVFFYRSKNFHGRQMAFYLMAYSSWRFFVEFFRGDPRGGVGAFSTSQLISAAGFVGGLVVYLVRRRTAARAVPPQQK